MATTGHTNMDALRYLMQKIDAVGIRWEDCTKDRVTYYSSAPKKWSRFQ